MFARLMAKSSATVGGGRVRHALLENPEGLPAHLERVRVAVESLRQQIAEAALERRMLAEADERLTRLMTVPGVGPVTAARFVTAIDDVGRPDACARAVCALDASGGL